MSDWFLNTSLEGLLKDAPRKKPAIAPVVECLTKLFGKSITNKEALSSITGTLLKNHIFVDAFLIEDYRHAALRTKPLIAPFVECFRTTTLEKSYL